MKCKFCGYEFDEDLGKYGCPNCLGEGLLNNMEPPKEKPTERNKMSNPCDSGDICNGQTNSETRLLPLGSSGNIILCRDCYKVELSFRLNRIMEGVEQDMPTWEGLAVSSNKVTEAVDPTEVYRRNNATPKGK